MTPLMKFSIVALTMVIISILIFFLNYFEIPIPLYMPYIYWTIAILIFLLILPEKSDSVFDEPK